jgi:protein-disulfide isomerase
MEGKPLTIPVAIVIAGALIGGAVIYSTKTSPESVPETAPQVETSVSFRPISENDHRLGNPNATITVIEYSDLECPACQFFHPTMKRLIAEYGKDGKVAWVYRHAPLIALHSKAPKEAEATECAGEQGGNLMFWKYVDTIFEVSPANNGLNLSRLPNIASDLGLNAKEFSECLASGKYAKVVDEDYNDALAAGLRGTPHNLLVLDRPMNQENAKLFKNQFKSSSITLSENRQVIVLPGAYPYEQMKALVETILDLAQ